MQVEEGAMRASLRSRDSTGRGAGRGTTRSGLFRAYPAHGLHPGPGCLRKTGRAHGPLRSQPRPPARPRMAAVGREARFSAAHSPAPGPEKGPRGGSASPWPAPLRPTHGVPCPPLPSSCGKSGRGRCCRRGAGEMRAQPLWAAALLLGALARGVGAGEWGAGGGSAGPRSAPRPAAAGVAPSEREPRRAGPARLRAERAREAGAVGARRGDLPGPGRRAMGARRRVLPGTQPVAAGGAPRSAQVAWPVAGRPAVASRGGPRVG